MLKLNHEPLNTIRDRLIRSSEARTFSYFVSFVRNVSLTKRKRQLNAMNPKYWSMLIRKVIKMTRGQFRTRLKYRIDDFQKRKLVEFSYFRLRHTIASVSVNAKDEDANSFVAFRDRSAGSQTTPKARNAWHKTEKTLVRSNRRI